jgi:N-acetylglucosaminyldiphosphoundecaprenol N-acetyl-beta-D-mannosaminyltransferase
MKTTIIGTNLDQATYSSSIELILSWASSHESRYACIANVHTIMEAYDVIDFKNLVNNADLVTPDGMPLVWMMRAKGVKHQERVYGPTLMLKVIESATREDIPVGFYGGAPRVLESLVKGMQVRYEGLNVAFSCSPPFRAMGPEEDAVIVEKINRSGTRILFVGLGCPKQEYWMSEHRGRVKAVMIGVGAAFDFHSGVKPQAPVWMQKMGLEWLFRLAVEPRRLWKRYLYHNPRFIFLAIGELLDLLKN